MKNKREKAHTRTARLHPVQNEKLNKMLEETGLSVNGLIETALDMMALKSTASILRHHEALWENNRVEDLLVKNSEAREEILKQKGELE